MERGTFAAASAGLIQLRKLDVTANNLANISTPGFKRQLTTGTEQRFEDTLAAVTAAGDPYARGDHDRVSGAVHAGVVTDFSLGAIRDTGNPLDVALRDPRDFFVVNTPDGVRYTRAGDFTLNAEGTLVAQDGAEIQGDGGPVSAPGPGVTVTAGGSVRSGGAEAGRVQVVRFEDPSVLERAGDTRFSLKSGAPAPAPVDPDLVPGALEGSNVSAVTGMIDLVAANRGFELYTRVAQSIDQLNQTSINQVGRSR